MILVGFILGLLAMVKTSGEVSQTETRNDSYTGDASFQTTYRGVHIRVVPDPTPEVLALVHAGMSRALDRIVQDPIIPEFTTRVVLGLEPSESSHLPGFWIRRDFCSLKDEVFKLTSTAWAEKQRVPELNLRQVFDGNLRALEAIQMNNLEIPIARSLVLEHELDKALGAAQWRTSDCSVASLASRYPKVSEACDFCIRGQVGRDSTVLHEAKSVVRAMVIHMFESMVPEALIEAATKLGAPSEFVPRIPKYRPPRLSES